MNGGGRNGRYPAPTWRSAPPLLVVVTALVSACGTIIQGTTQQVSISSAPAGAEVTVDNVSLGTTPLVGDLKRKDHHLVRITLAGYRPYEIALARSVSGWVAGNIVFGGIIGLAVDAIAGGMYKLTPEQVVTTLEAGAPAAVRVLDPDDLVVLVVLRPQLEWEPIATLERE